jgi:hypothetical protein
MKAARGAEPRLRNLAPPGWMPMGRGKYVHANGYVEEDTTRWRATVVRSATSRVFVYKATRAAAMAWVERGGQEETP